MSKKNPPKRQELTQAESQQLLAILRKELPVLQEEKVLYKHKAAKLWLSCLKGDWRTFSSFLKYSRAYKKFKQVAEKEKTLVNLITKLKTQR